jgi:phospholipid/cholesterol/gamma-HCH transport system substrate-binding protein
MKFTIRFADQIVGILIIIALAALVGVVFLLGSSQRWFSKDYEFKTYFDSGAGLSKNMAVQYKGFTIGRVKNFDLTWDDRVEVRFYIFDTYISRVRRGSLVDISISPVGLGNQFRFYPGLGSEQLEEGELIPAVTSREGREALEMGLAYLSRQDDSIGVLLSQVNSVLASVDTLAKDLSGVLVNVNVLAEDLSGAIEGTGATSLGRTFGNVEQTTQGLTEITEMVQGTVDQIMASIQPILANLTILSDDLSDPNGAVARVLDGEGPVYTNLASTLESVSGTIKSLEKTIAYVPTQLPQITTMLSEVQQVLRSAEDVLIALTNNPLLKNGVGSRVENQPTGTSMRDLNF